MFKKICKINSIHFGTFCHIKTKNMNVLLTNYIDEDDDFINKANLEYQIIGSNEKKKINMKKDRFKLTDKDLKFAIIEILEEDKVSNFIEIDNGHKFPEEYKNQDISYICESKKAKEGLIMSDGKISDIANMHFNYRGNLINSNGTPLMLKSNSTLIGLNVGERKALSIKEIINKMELKAISIKKTNNKINYIKCLYNIEKKNSENQIQIINNGYFGIKDFNKDNINDLFCRIIEDEDGWKKKIKKEENEELKVKSKFIIDEKCYEKELQYKFSKKELQHKFSEKNNRVDITAYIILDWDLEKLNYLFSECECLQEVDFSNFNSDKITDMSYMFLNCFSLKKIIFPEKFNTKNVTNMNSMFCNCSSLEEINLTSFNTENVIDMACMFSGCSKLKKIINKSKESDNTEKNETFNKTKPQEIGSEILNSEINAMLKINEPKSKTLNNKNNNKGNKAQINNYTGNDPFNIINNKSNSSTKQNDNLIIFNTSKVENMSCMFSECSSLEGEINLSESESNNIKYMSFMFYKCENLRKIELSLRNYEVDMKNMFNGCKCQEYILKGKPKIDENKKNIFGIFEDIKYYHFLKFKFTKIECDNEELQDIAQKKKYVYISNILLIALMILLLLLLLLKIFKKI